MPDMGSIKNFTSDGAINPRRFVVFVATDGRVAQASGAAGEKIAGCSGVIGTLAAGERVDVCLDDVQTIEAGAAFPPGSPLVADALGRAIRATPAAGAVAVGGAVALEASFGEGQHVQVIVRPSPVVG